MSSESKFDKAWANPKTQRIIGIFYSLGASVVIVGAMGKILHTDWGGAMLGAGMTIEAVLFALGALDKPHKEQTGQKLLTLKMVINLMLVRLQLQLYQMHQNHLFLILNL